MLDNMYYIFMLICKVFVIYFGIISIFSIFGKKKEKTATRKMKFAALIAARNEEDCIEGIIDTLKNQNYPKELIDIYVIPNNCTDNTAVVARARGANVLQAPESVKYKGEALNFAIDKLLNNEKKYEAFLVFDADNEICGEFVSSMNNTLLNGFRVAKSRILAKNPKDRKSVV